MAVDAGSARGFLELDINGFVKALRDAQGQANTAGNRIASSIGSAFQSVGSRLQSVGSQLTNSITKPAGVAATALAGITLAKGWERLVGIDTARAKLTGLGHDAESVQNIMDSALASVRGTSLGMADAANAAAGAVAAGIEPGQELTRYLTLVGDAASIAGTDLAEMGPIFNRVTTAGRAYTGELNQLADRGLPIFQWLAEEMNVTAEEARNLASEGKVTTDILLAAIETNIGGAAKIMGDSSFTASLQNVWAAVGRIGANFLDAGGAGGGFFSQMIPLVSEFRTWLETLEPVAAELGVKFGQAFSEIITRIREAITWFINLDGDTKRLIATIGGIALAAGPVITVLGRLTSGIGGLIKGISGFSKGIQVFWSMRSAIAAVAGPVAAVVAAIAVLAAAFADLWQNNEEFRNNIINGWNALVGKFQEFTQGIVDRLNALGFSFEDITEVLSAIWNGFVELLAPVFENVWNTIVTILSSVMDIITGLLDVFIGVFTGDWEQAWNGVQNIFSGIWDGIVGIFSGILSTFQNIANTVLGWFGTSWEQLWTDVSTFFVNIWNNIVSFFQNIWTNITNGFTSFIDAIVGFFTSLPGNIAGFFSEVFNNVAQWGADMWNKAIETGSNFINAIVEFFSQLPYNIGLFIGTALGTIAQWAIDVWNKAIEVGTNFINAIVEFFSQLPTNIANFISEAWNSIVNWVTDMVAKAAELGSTFLANIVNFFSQLPGNIANFLSSAWNNVTTWAGNMARSASEAASNFLNNIISTISKLPGQLWEWLVNTANQVVTWAADLVTKGRDAIVGMGNAIVNAAKALPGQMLEIGRNIVQGVWNGIQAAAGWFWDQITGFFGGIVDGVKGALGIGSPSKVFANEVGRWLPPGVARGFENAMPVASRNIRDSLNRGIASIKVNSIKAPEVEEPPKTFIDDVRSLLEEVKPVFGELTNWFNDLAEAIKLNTESIANSIGKLKSAEQVGAPNEWINGGAVSNGNISVNGGRIDYNAIGSSTGTYAPNRGNSSLGDTFVFNSPVAIDEIEAAKLLRRTKRDLAEGF